jgi:hypothetical protein
VTTYKTKQHHNPGHPHQQAHRLHVSSEQLTWTLALALALFSFCLDILSGSHRSKVTWTQMQWIINFVHLVTCTHIPHVMLEAYKQLQQIFSTNMNYWCIVCYDFLHSTSQKSAYTRSTQRTNKNKYSIYKIITTNSLEYDR